jgi:thymidylate kinase
MPSHLILEGAELSGKSWVLSQLYSNLEPAGATNPDVLDGCYWFNCDLGFFGTAPAPQILPNYLKIFQALAAKNILVEKFHLSELVYDELYNTGRYRYFLADDFEHIERRLQDLDFKIVLLTFPEDRELLARRLEDRLKLYPHYRRIAKTPEFYLKQQALYLERLKASSLEYLVLEAAHFPDDELVGKIREWIKI